LEAEIPEALDNLTGEERNRVYRMLRLEIKPTPDGYETAGVFLQKGTDALLTTSREKGPERAEKAWVRGIFYPG
jgi:hypothetical protein